MEIQEIKSRLSILTVLNHYHLQPDRHQMLKCPFHEDDQPSFKVYTETNTFNCFGLQCQRRCNRVYPAEREPGQTPGFNKSSRIMWGTQTNQQQTKEPINAKPYGNTDQNL